MGHTSLWMFPIYGLGAFVLPVGEYLKRRSGKNAMRGYLLRGALYMSVIFLTEYVTGSWLRKQGICPWDYTGKRTNFEGLIRLDFAPLWFLTGLLFEQITKKRGA